MMAPGISLTLWEKLFERPDPPARRLADFARLTPVMFPAGADFRGLLETRDAERQTEIAKSILLALAFESAVFPPNKFIKNLLDFESRVAGQAGGGNYVARDHFVHLVHLYLIGLYVFWYHTGLHRQLCDQMKRLLPTEASHDKPSVQRSCVSAWRTFVLFHDLGYPWEAFGQAGQPWDCVEPFADAVEYAAKESAVYVVAQLIALEWVLSEESHTLGKILDELRPKRRGAETPLPREWPSCKAQVKDAIRLRNLGDHALVELVQNIVTSERLVPVVECVTDEQPCASSQPILHRYLGTRETRARHPIPDSLTIEQWVENRQVPPDRAEEFQLTFYARDFNAEYEKFLNRLFDHQIPDLDEPTVAFREFARAHLAKRPPERPSGAQPRFADFAFAVYRELLETLDFDILDRSVSHALQLGWTLSSREYSGLEQIVLRDVLDDLQKRITEQAGKLRGEPGNDIAELGLDAYLQRLLKPVTSASLPSTIHLSHGLRDRVLLKGNLYRFYRKLRDPISTLLGPVPATFAIPSAAGKKKVAPTSKVAHSTPYWHLLKVPDLSVMSDDPLAQRADTLLRERGLSGLDALQTYLPEYAKRARASGLYLDHGIAAGLLHTTLHRAIRTLHSRAGKELSVLLLLRGGLEENYVEEKVAELETGFAAEILYAILVHNLYPAHMSDPAHRDWRTNQAATLAFFSMICDNLQHWDRKSLCNLARGQLPYGTNAEHFDIDIVDDRFRISERGPKVEAGERLKRLRSDLDLFLEGAAVQIKVGLKEWDL